MTILRKSNTLSLVLRVSEYHVFFFILGIILGTTLGVLETYRI